MSNFSQVIAIDDVEVSRDGMRVRDTEEFEYIINTDMIIDIFPAANIIRMIDGARYVLTSTSMKWLLKHIEYKLTDK